MENLNLNIKKMLSLRGVVLGLTFTTMVGSLTGCGDKVDCSVDESHAHLYTNDEGYVKYINSEKVLCDDYTRSRDYVLLSDEEEKLNEFLNKKGLIRIDDNLDLLLTQQENNGDYVEYQYKHSYLKPIPVWAGCFYFCIPWYVEEKGWTEDQNHEYLTGEQRECHYEYKAYNVVKDEKGKYVLVPSDCVDDFGDLVDGYTYVKEDDFEILTYDDGNERAATQSCVGYGENIEYSLAPKLTKNYYF